MTAQHYSPGYLSSLCNFFLEWVVSPQSRKHMIDTGKGLMLLDSPGQNPMFCSCWLNISKLEHWLLSASRLCFEVWAAAEEQLPLPFSGRFPQICFYVFRIWRSFPKPEACRLSVPKLTWRGLCYNSAFLVKKKEKTNKTPTNIYMYVCMKTSNALVGFDSVPHVCNTYGPSRQLWVLVIMKGWV